MALVSPGVSVTITDDSFYVPAAAPTVPLIFIATEQDKLNSEGTAVAPGTTESGVVRQVSSLGQSFSLYGVPKFRYAEEDDDLLPGVRRQKHGDATNEYGLFALNQVLNELNLAYVVRADVDLANKGTTELVAQTPIYVGIGDGSLSSVTVVQNTAVEEVWTITATSATVFTVSGSISGAQGTVTVGSAYNNGIIAFNISAGSIDFVAGDRFTVSIASQVQEGPLGVNDAQRRANVVAALASEINSNQDVRSEIFEYNLIMCPGYHEVVDEMQSLQSAVNDEAFILADTPMNMSPEEITIWAQTTDAKDGNGTAYAYPHGLASNLDGAEVLCASSGIIGKVIAKSDSNGYVWDAAAGPIRGIVTGVARLGYASGDLGEVTTFNEVILNQGQRDALYLQRINPIAFFPGRGMMVFGQKTRATVASAMDRTNVSREMMYIKRALRKGAFSYLFQPNDQITRDNLKAMVDGFLGDVMMKRGLYDYATLCDESNNTPTRIDRNELWCDVAVKPVKIAEFIYIPVRVAATGDDI